MGQAKNIVSWCEVKMNQEQQKMKKQFVLIIIGLTMMLGITGCSSDKPFWAGKGDKLTGDWTCAYAVVDGKPVPDAKVQILRLTLTSKRYTTQMGPEVLFDSTYTIDATKKPKQIEMVGTEGTMRGKNALGIYELANDTFTICYTMPGKPRPTEFESTPGSGAYLATWKRAE